MALIKRILLIRYNLVKAENGEQEIITEPQFYEGNESKIFTKGCMDWVLYNLGTATVFLWGGVGGVPVLPGTYFYLSKSSPFNFGNNIPITFEGTYESSHDIADADEGEIISA